MLYFVGAAFLFWGMYNVISSLYIKSLCKGSTSGELTGIEEHMDYNRGIPGAKCYSPVYSYRINDKEYKYSPKKYVKDPLFYEIGKKVEIRYNEVNPEVCLVNGKSDKWGVVVICVIIGVVLCIIASARNYLMF